jgi:teichuronic acid biosynthesis glycosyltransferase TuaG
MPTISVVLTTYNREIFLSEAIGSILDQTYQDFELIIVDNFSDYDIEKSISNHKSSKIKFFQNANYGNIAINRNFGIKKGSGDFIAFCDDDDIWMANKLEIQMSIIKEKNADLVYCGINIFEKECENFLTFTPARPIANINDLLIANPIALSTVIVKNNDIYFPEDPNYIGLEDYYLWISLFIRGNKFSEITEAYVYYRDANNNYTARIGELKHLKKVFLLVNFLITDRDRINIRPILNRIYLNIFKYQIKRFLKKLKLKILF